MPTIPLFCTVLFLLLNQQNHSAITTPNLSFVQSTLPLCPLQWIRSHAPCSMKTHTAREVHTLTHTRSICLQNAPTSQPVSNATEWQNRPPVTTLETERPDSMSTCLGVIPMSCQATWLLLLLLETVAKVFAAVVWRAVCTYRSTLTVSFSSSSVGRLVWTRLDETG